LVVAIGAAGLKELVDESGFAMVNVGDNGEVTDLERHGGGGVMGRRESDGAALCTVLDDVARRDWGKFGERNVTRRWISGPMERKRS
jgi:hypothetical protein